MKSHRFLKSKKKINDKRATIKELHNTKMDEFEKYYKTLPKEKEKLKLLISEKDEIDKQEYDYNRITRKRRIEDDIKSLEIKIKEMENKTDMLTYLGRVSKVLLKLSTSKNEKNEKNEKKKKGVGKYIIVKEGNNKGSLLNEYLQASNGTMIAPKTLSHEELFTCENCKSTLVVDQKECNLTCHKCGVSKHWQDPELPQWSDEVDVSKAYRYKRLGYFIEHLYRFQAKECRVIPQSVINKLLKELRKRRITEPNQITSKLIRGFLKQLDITGYYDNVNSIIRTLSGKEAPVFPEELEDRLIVMFMKTQQPFEKYKNLIPGRNNYLSYPYVIQKLLIIISKEDDDKKIMEFVPWFPLLKSRQKLWYQEKVWEKVCLENNWTFYKSI